MDFNTYWEEDTTPNKPVIAEDTSETSISENPDAGKFKDFSTSIVNGHTVANKNKDYNDFSGEQLQAYLSKVYDQRIYTDTEGMKYQLETNGNKKYLNDQDTKTSFLYGGPSKTNPDIVKFGVGKHGVEARYANEGERKTYDKQGKGSIEEGTAGKQGRKVNKGKSKGYPSGIDGIDASKAFVDWELPQELAEGVEKFIHGNYGDISSRIMYKDGSLFGLKAGEAFGAGKSEYYDKDTMTLMNQEPIDSSRIDDRDDIKAKEHKLDKSIPTIEDTPTTALDTTFDDYWEESKDSTTDKAIELAKGILPPQVRYIAGEIADIDTEGIVNSVNKLGEEIRDNDLGTIARDAGRGLTAGIYDSVNTVVDPIAALSKGISNNVDGVVEAIGVNPFRSPIYDGLTYVDEALGTNLSGSPVSDGLAYIADKSDEVADRIRASNEIPNSEVERLGELASEGAIGSLAMSKAFNAGSKLYNKGVKGNIAGIKELEDKAELAYIDGWTKSDKILMSDKLLEGAKAQKEFLKPRGTSMKEQVQEVNEAIEAVFGMPKKIQDKGSKLIDDIMDNVDDGVFMEKSLEKANHLLKKSIDIARTNWNAPTPTPTTVGRKVAPRYLNGYEDLSALGRVSADYHGKIVNLKDELKNIKGSVDFRNAWEKADGSWLWSDMAKLAKENSNNKIKNIGNYVKDRQDQLNKIVYPHNYSADTNIYMEDILGKKTSYIDPLNILGIDSRRLRLDKKNLMKYYMDEDKATNVGSIVGGAATINNNE